MVSAPSNQLTMTSLPSDFLVPMQIEPVGRWFLSHYQRMNSARGTSIGNESLSETESEVSDEEDDFEDDINYLRSLDPKDCKNQDHYKVLGLTKLRFKASDDQIKRAYRQKVLRHHPDKRRGQGEDIREDDDYFTCITRAFENLGMANKRRAFDSVDPLFDDDIPDPIKDNSKDFFAIFAPVLERNARWSTKRQMPDIGNMETPRDKVDKFYKFWYDFESWREYSYLDEEDKEKGSDREERRWIEKNNKIQRAEKKKEEMKRIRRLVDNAYNSDPRIAMFKENDKQEKAAKKKAKQDAVRLRKEAEEKERREAEEKAKKEQEEKDRLEKERKEKEKNEKEAFKKALKNERKSLRTICKNHDYFANGNDDTKVQNMTEVDRLCEILSLDELKGLNSNLSGKSKDDDQRFFIKAVDDLNSRLEKEKLELVEKATKGSSGVEKATSSKPWTSEELNHLIKAVNLFPAGTTNRLDTQSRIFFIFMGVFFKVGSGSLLHQSTLKRFFAKRKRNIEQG